MFKFFFLFLTIFASLLVAQDAQAIIEKADEYRGSENWSFDLKIIDFAKEGENVKIFGTDEYKVLGQVFNVGAEKIFKSVCQFTEPVAERGKKMFMDGQIYWMFFPDTKNIIRMTPAQRLSGQATASDIASINYANDYKGKVIGSEVILSQHDCHLLELTKKHENVAYDSMKYWVEKVTYKPIKVEFFGSSGKLLKTGYYRDFRPVVGKMQSHELFLLDPLTEGRVTRMIQSNKTEVKAPEYFFRKESLANINLLEHAATPDAQEIIVKADRYRGADKWGCDMKVMDLQREEAGVKLLAESEFRLATKVYRDNTVTFKSFVQFLSPKQDQGKKMLMDGQIYWMSFPDTQNLVRITPSQRLTGQATAADIASTNFSTDYEGKVLGMETVLGKDCYKLKLTAKHENTAYGSLDYWVEKNSYEPVKVDYFAISGKMLKTAFFRDLKMSPAMGGVKVHELFIVDPLLEGHVTRIIYSNMVPEDRPDHFFSKETFSKLNLAVAPVEVTPLQIIKAADQYRGAENWAFDMTILDIKRVGEEVKELGRNGFSNVAKVFNESDDQVRKCLCLFTSPESEVGKKMLMDGQIYWLFFPTTKNLVRITPQQRLAGQATAADIASTNFEYDYNGEFGEPKEEVVLKSQCYKLVLTSKANKNVAYHKLHYWVEKESFRPIKIEYFTDSGKHLKTAFYRQFESAEGMNGQIKAHELFILDPVEEGRVTRLLYSNIKHKVT